MIILSIYCVVLFSVARVYCFQFRVQQYFARSKIHAPIIRFELKATGFGSSSGSGFKSPKKSNATNTVISVENNFRGLTTSTSEDLLFPVLKSDKFRIRQIHTNPPIYEIDNFFDSELCDDYMQRAQSLGEKRESQTFSTQYGVSSVRTSTTWYHLYKQVPEMLLRIREILNIPIERYEEPQIVRYEMGQQFTWHYDALPASLAKKTSGQRIATVLIYLNTVEAGGATAFKDLNIRVKPEKGKALIFFPCSLDGVPDDRTMHAGQISFDTKWIAQLWVRERNYIPTIPEGNSHDEGVKAIEELITKN